MAATKKTTKAKAEKKEKFSKETYMFWFENMLLQRRFEEKAGQLYGQQKIRGFCHLYIGQEACSSGSVTALEKGDKWITAYRDHGQPLALGTDPKAIMAELMAKETGISKGKGGSMHMFDKENGFFGGHGIVGGQVPLGAGIAFAEKYNKTGKLCICMMGDGAVRQGAFHEALNMAMTWKEIPSAASSGETTWPRACAVERSFLYHRSPAVALPIIRSEWPPTCLVSACTLISQPRFNAGKPSAVAQVLSIRLTAPRSRAIRVSSGMSQTSIVRLPGLSSSTARVRSQKLASKPARSSVASLPSAE